MRNSRKKFKIVSSKIFSTMIVMVILAIYSLIAPINKINAATYNQTIINDITLYAFGTALFFLTAIKQNQLVRQ